MLIYNTTYHLEEKDVKNFLIWLREVYIPEIQKTDLLHTPRLCRILSHYETDSECYSLEWKVENSGVLHQWHTRQGNALNEEMLKIFKDKVLAIPTLLEVME